MKKIILLTLIACFGSYAFGENIVSPEQVVFTNKYKNKSITKPENALINTDKEPDLSDGFINLYNGKDLSGWKLVGGKCEFLPEKDHIRGVCVKKEPSTYLTTIKNDYKDFIFTVEMKWEVVGNSGVMFRAQEYEQKSGISLRGPQAEMEGFTRTDNRSWSGGIFGQSYGGWQYPLWLEAHREAREALKEGEFNRITIKVVGDVVKTWLNGAPAAHWILDDERFSSGVFGLQVHKGNKGTILFRNIKVKEL